MLLHSYSNVVSFCWNLVFWPKHFYIINFPIPTIVSTEKFSAAKLLLEVVWLELIKSSVIRFTRIKGGKNKQPHWQRTKYKDSSSSFHSNQALAPLPCHWVYIWTFPSICLQLRDAPLLIKCLWVFYLLLRDGGGWRCRARWEVTHFQIKENCWEVEGKQLVPGAPLFSID